jgi:hypothetical protein
VVSGEHGFQVTANGGRATTELPRRRSGSRLAATAALLGLLGPAAARACTVCYGAADDAMIDGTRLSVVFLLGLTYLLLGGGVGMFLFARRRHHRTQKRADSP